ncbi:MAG TPA: type II secretion system F family protein [Pirellulaceae bacterium]|nr:type II secretion system F family protein [Pirellulaceae bacterium]
MPWYEFEAMDATGQEFRDEIEAPTEEEAQTQIRTMGYFVTKLQLKKQAAGSVGKQKKARSLAIGGASGKVMCTFTRQLSILQDAGLPVLRSLKILESQSKAGALKNALMDVCEEIESGSTLSEAMAKSPKVFNRLYVNMIKAGEAGGALEVILRRLADFMERAESLKRKVKGAMIYPIVVVLVAIGILTFIMIKIVPVFKKMFDEFELKLPVPTEILIKISEYTFKYFYFFPLFPIGIWLSIKIIRKFRAGRMGWDLYILKLPVAGNLVEKNILARTTRTLGTLVSSGVPILEGLNITRETSGNAMFEMIFGRVTDAIREGETIAKPMRENSRPGFHPVAMFFWMMTFATPFSFILFIPKVAGFGAYMSGGAAVLGALFYLTRMNQRVVDELVVNMVDVGEETGELDTMLYKVADYYDEEVTTLTDGLVKLLEPLMIVFLGCAVGFIVISLFMPLVELISKLS